MLQDTITDNMVNTVLKQMGATSIKTKPAYINIVKFELTDSVRLIYLYEIKENESIYLQRLEPYRRFIGEPGNEDELIRLIKHDLDRFKDALVSDNFSRFIIMSDKLNIVNNKIEALLLSPKFVEAEDLTHIEADLDHTEMDIDTMASNAKLK